MTSTAFMVIILEDMTRKIKGFAGTVKLFEPFWSDLRLRLDVGAGDKGYFVVGLAVLAIGSVTLLPRPILVVALVAGVILLWWLTKLDWWRRFYVLTLVFAIGAKATLVPLAAAAEYGRYVSVLLLLVVTWAAAHNTTQQKMTRLQRRMIVALWAIVAISVLSTFWSVDPTETIIQSIALGVFVAIIHHLMVGRWLNRNTMIADLTVAHNVLIGSFVISLVAWFAGYADAMRGERFQGIYNNPNVAAQMAVLALFLGWGIYRHRPNMLRLGSMVPAFVVMVLAESRTVFVAFAIAVIWMILRSSIKTYLVTVYLVVVGLCVALMFESTPLVSLLDRFGSHAGGDLFGGRLELWDSAINLTLEQPFGYGWAASGTLFESMFGYVDFTTDLTSVHNSYLQFLLEIGFIGLLPLLYLVIGFLAIAIRGNPDGVGIALIGTVVCGATIQFTESSMFGIGQPYPYIFWFCVAAALTMYEQRASILLNFRAHPGGPDANRDSRITRMRELGR